MEAFEAFANGLAVEVLRIVGLLHVHDLCIDGEQSPQHRMNIVHYHQPHMDRAEWLMIIHECRGSCT